jgi:hypothetical protein
MIINRPFESEALQKESERLKSMHDLLKEIENEEKSRTEISKRYVFVKIDSLMKKN